MKLIKIIIISTADCNGGLSLYQTCISCIQIIMQSKSGVLKIGLFY
jgi:hypothetical protein